MAERALQKNAASLDQREFAERKERQRDKRRRALVGRILNTYDGREFVWDELARSRMFDKAITSDVHLMYEHLGRRSHGLALYDELKAFPELFRQMEKEADDRATREDREREAAQADSVST